MFWYDFLCTYKNGWYHRVRLCDPRCCWRWWRETTDLVILSSPWLRRETGHALRSLWVLLHVMWWCYHIDKAWAGQHFPFLLVKSRVASWLKVELQILVNWYWYQLLWWFNCALCPLHLFLCIFLDYRGDGEVSGTLPAGCRQISMALFFVSVGMFRLLHTSKESLLGTTALCLGLFLSSSAQARAFRDYMEIHAMAIASLVFCHCNVHPLTFLLLVLMDAYINLQHFLVDTQKPYKNGWMNFALDIYVQDALLGKGYCRASLPSWKHLFARCVVFSIVQQWVL